VGRITAESLYDMAQALAARARELPKELQGELLKGWPEGAASLNQRNITDLVAREKELVQIETLIARGEVKEVFPEAMFGEQVND